MRRGTKLYNLILPLWLLWIFPQTWLVVLPANFIVDLLVSALALRFAGARGIAGVLKFSILRTWLCGFAADAAGTALMAAPLFALRRGRPVIGKIGYLPSGKMPSWYEVEGPSNPGDPDAGQARMVEMRAYADYRHPPEIVDVQGNPITALDTIFVDRRTGRNRGTLHAQVAFYYEPYWGHGAQNVSRRLIKVQIFGV